MSGAVVDFPGRVSPPMARFAYDAVAGDVLVFQLHSGEWTAARVAAADSNGVVGLVENCIGETIALQRLAPVQPQRLIRDATLSAWLRSSVCPWFETPRQLDTFLRARIG